jgi:hypothetical protein
VGTGTARPRPAGRAPGRRIRPRASHRKLLALGATPDLLAPDRLIYQDFPSRTWDGADYQALADLLDHTRPALVGLDSAGAFLAVAGLSENESEHVTGFYKAVLLHAARRWNAAVIVLDHQGKQTKLAGTPAARVPSSP